MNNKTFHLYRVLSFLVTLSLFWVLVPIQATQAAPPDHWNTFLGGSSYDYSYSSVIDEDGNIYIGGQSQATWGTPLVAYAGETEVFIAKLEPDGDLLWHTFLGGSDDDCEPKITLDDDGKIYVTGYSYATWGSPLNAHTGSEDIFVAKLDADGSLLWNTFLGGSSTDWATSIDLDGSKNIYIAGYSWASWGTPLRAFSDSGDGFAAKLDNSGNLLWNTFLGGTSVDRANDLVVDGSGNSYIAGKSDATWGSPVDHFATSTDGFVVKLDTAGGITWSTFIGTGGVQAAHGIDLDDSGNVYTVGDSKYTWGSPVHPLTGAEDAFVAKLDSSGNRLWHTFMGGSERDYGEAITVDALGGIFVAGYSYATWGNPLQAFSAGTDGFIARLDASGNQLWNTFMGGSGSEIMFDLSTDGAGSLVVHGYSTAAWGSPVRAYTSGNDGFVYKMNPVGPVVASITRLETSPIKDYSVDFQVQFTETVTGVDAADFFITATGLTGAAVTNITGSGDTYTVTVGTGEGDSGTIRLDVTDNDSIVGGIYNVPLGGSGINNADYTSGELYEIIDNYIPILLTPTESTDLLYNLPDFDWMDVPGAVGYTIQVGKTDTFKGYLVNTTAVDSKYTPTKALTSNTTVYWHVRTKLADGTYSDWSEMRSLDTANPPGTVKTSTPKKNDLVETNPPTFTWKTAKFPTGTTFSVYEIQIATDEDFISVWDGNTVTSATYTPSTVMDPGTTYYWHVRTYNTDGEYSSWSKTGYFRIPYAPPNLLTPMDGSNSNSLRPTFTWEATVGATSYTIQISLYDTFSKTLLKKTTTETSFTYTKDFTEGTTIYWRVSVNGAFGPGGWSDTWSLVITP